MISLFVWGVAQIVLVALSSKDCGDANNPFAFICEFDAKDATLLFYFPASILLLMNVKYFIYEANL